MSPMGWRALLHRIPLFERRWFPRPDEREAHAELVRRRLDSDPVAAPADSSDPPEADPEAAGSSFASGGWR
jgi:hypothetical protein